MRKSLKMHPAQSWVGTDGCCQPVQSQQGSRLLAGSGTSSKGSSGQHPAMPLA
jgi:hypothetical protein